MRCATIGRRESPERKASEQAGNAIAPARRESARRAKVEKIEYPVAEVI
jgi:hypothetical protein